LSQLEPGLIVEGSIEIGVVDGASCIVYEACSGVKEP
jgi:hypothetical protein